MPVEHHLRPGPAPIAQRAASVAVVAAASDQVAIDATTWRAMWLLLAIVTVVLLWAIYELRRRRKLALRLDRLSAVSGAPRYPTASERSPEDFEALIDIVSLDDRLPAIAQRIEALSASHELTDAVEDDVSESDDATDSGSTRT